MERLIIQGIQRLRVLTPYDYDNMDELVHDLNSALEETAHNRSASQKHHKKGKSWKRRPKPSSSSFVTLGSSVPKSSAVSEDSESSLDDRMRCRMEMAVGGTLPLPLSDSDEIQNNKNHLLSWRHCVASLVESDSVNENFLPTTRAHRRKRKFKRMAVDPQPGVSSSASAGGAGAALFGASSSSSALGMILPSGGGGSTPHHSTSAASSLGTTGGATTVAGGLGAGLGAGDSSLLAFGPSSSISPKSRKVKSVRMIKNKGKHSRLLDADIENICSLAAMKRGESTSYCGKRKRSMRERSVECPRHEDHEFRFPLPGGTTGGMISLYCNSARAHHHHHHHHHLMECDSDAQRTKNQMEGSSSSLSSSESDGGLFTNDEGREADDEHSDFFHEAGPTCGIPGLTNPWWENDPEGANLMNGIDAQFQALLHGTFEHMSQEAKDGYHESVSRYLAGAGREIRAGRRRLGQMRPSFSVLSSVNEQISKFMQDPLSNELRLENIQYSDDDQLQHLATLYSLEVQKVGQNQNKGVVLIKTRRTTQSVREDLNHCKASLSDIKRRRRMPPINMANATAGLLGLEGANGPLPLPDHNLGNRMLRNMGWEPGMGLGPAGQGIQNPLMACVRAKYQGLGFDAHPGPSGAHLGAHLGSHVHLGGGGGSSHSGAPPPPPPPSPQPFLSSCSGGDGDTTPQSESFDATSSIVVGHFQQDLVSTDEKSQSLTVR